MGGVEVVVAHRDRAVVAVGDLFLKIEADERKAYREHAAMSAAPVPVPEVAWRQGSVTALRAVAGRPIDGSDPPSVWRAAGAFARALHQCSPPPGLDRMFVAERALAWLDADRAWLVEEGLLEADVVDAHHRRAVDALAGRDVPDVFLHGDLQAAHVFVDGDEITGVLDWADACAGDPMFDLAVLTGMHTDRLDDVVAGYGAADLRAIRSWWSLRWLGEVRWMVEHGFDIEDKLTALRTAL